MADFTAPAAQRGYAFEKLLAHHPARPHRPRPAYDLLNSTIALKNPPEEMALPIGGKRSHLTRADLFDYFATERLQINPPHRDGQPLSSSLPALGRTPRRQLPLAGKKAAYASVLAERKARLEL